MDAIPADAIEPAPPVTTRRGDIAIVGLAARFPGARDAEAFWRALEAGTCAIRDFDALAEPGGRGPDHVAAGAIIDDPFDFDAEFFRCTPREAELLDPQIRLFVEHCHLALEDAGVDPARARRVGVFAGQSHSRYHDRAQDSVTDAASRFLAYVSNDKDYLATQAAWRLGLTGPALAIQTACSTSLVAVHVAARSLADGECDVALAGGVTLHTPQATGYDPGVTGIFSPTGRCRPFEARSDGTVFGNGVGVVALRRLDDALRDGDAIYAVIRGSAVNNDGPRRVGFTAPGQDGQLEVIRAALARAEVDPATITYVEAHGTGTPLGDPIEAAAFATPSTPPTAPVRPRRGQGQRRPPESAAGVAGLIKAALAPPRRPALSPTSAANPRIPFAEMPLRVLDAREPWTLPPGVPPRGGQLVRHRRHQRPRRARTGPASADPLRRRPLGAAALDPPRR
ncbi:MAG: polyketide synthase [bacterium]